MTQQPEPTIGAIEWHDLTVDNAEDVADFYSQVVGWQTSPASMGDYDDYNINQADGSTVAGVCHARGSNVDLPPQWLMYVRVASVAESARNCQQLGGEVIEGPRKMSGMDFCVVKDPAGAVLALMSE